jgi:hypothetical protein
VKRWFDGVEEGNDLRMKDVDSVMGVCSFLETKLALFKKYLSVTKRMKAGSSSQEADHLGQLIVKRQDLIQKIDRIDMSIKRMISRGSDKPYPVAEKIKGLVDSYSKSIKKIMEKVESLDRELSAAIKQEGDSIKTDLLGMQQVRKAAKGYGSFQRYPAKFLDTRR